MIRAPWGTRAGLEGWGGKGGPGNQDGSHWFLAPLAVELPQGRLEDTWVSEDTRGGEDTKGGEDIRDGEDTRGGGDSAGGAGFSRAVGHKVAWSQEAGRGHEVWQSMGPDWNAAAGSKMDIWVQGGQVWAGTHFAGYGPGPVRLHWGRRWPQRVSDSPLVPRKEAV